MTSFSSTDSSFAKLEAWRDCGIAVFWKLRLPPLSSHSEEKTYSEARSKKIVRLGYGLASNHAFLDGNKRIGALAMQTLLAANGYSFPVSNDELADMFLSIAAGSAGEADLLAWTQQHLQQMYQWMP